MGGQLYCPVVCYVRVEHIVGDAYLGTAKLGNGLGSLGNGVLGKLCQKQKVR
jgi:hypothetical protein